jgi:hypothetical protein
VSPKIETEVGGVAHRIPFPDTEPDYVEHPLDRVRAHQASHAVLRGFVQTKTPPAPKFTMIKASDAYLHIRKGEDAVEDFRATKEQADALYEVMVAQANLKKVHEEVDKTYEEAKKAREKALEKSTMKKVVGAIAAIAEISTGVGGILKLAQPSVRRRGA